jgi:hypothetical protein
MYSLDKKQNIFNMLVDGIISEYYNLTRLYTLKDWSKLGIDSGTRDFKQIFILSVTLERSEGERDRAWSWVNRVDELWIYVTNIWMQTWHASM